MFEDIRAPKDCTGLPHPLNTVMKCSVSVPFARWYFLTIAERLDSPTLKGFQ
jgi:hypothetical protein